MWKKISKIFILLILVSSICLAYSPRYKVEVYLGVKQTYYSDRVTTVNAGCYSVESPKDINGQSLGNSVLVPIAFTVVTEN